VSRELSSFGKKEWQLPQREYMCGEGESRYAHCKAQLRANQIGGLFIGQLSLQPASQSGVLVNT